MTNSPGAFIANHSSYTLVLPERHKVPIDKYSLLPQQLLHRGIAEEKDFFEPEPVDPIHLCKAHSADYVNRALQLKLTPKEARRIGYPYTQELIERELRIVNGTLRSAEIALEFGLGLNVAGGTHHAGSNWGEGFCLFNDVAVSSYFLWEAHQVEKILIIDLDVHQGNGTAEILQNENRAFTFSMHAKNNFPFRKSDSDLDLALADRTEGEEYLALLEKTLTRLIRNEQPEFIFYLAGADVLQVDKLGRLSLSLEDCKQRDQLVFDFCKQYKIPVQVSTAGGYAERVADTVDVHSQTFELAIHTLFS